MSQRTTLISVGVLLAVAAVTAFAVYSKNRTSVPPPVAVQVALTPVHTVIGHSVESRAIDAYTYGTGPIHLLFVGGMHGGYEWNAVALAYTYKKYLDAHPESVPSSMSITVIPALNVDGVYAVTGTTGPISAASLPAGVDTVPGRVNAQGVDLNRNFDCHWQPEATWRSTPVSAGVSPFSEPESSALRDYISTFKPAAVVFWHSQSGSVYASECDSGILPVTLHIMHAYATAAGYGEVKKFDAYPVTGDSEGWLASVGIPAITVELTTHVDIEWDKNLSGIESLLRYFALQTK